MFKYLKWALFVSLVYVAQAGFLAEEIYAVDLAAGKAKYQQLCVACHGATGKGDGPAAIALKPKPKDLSATTKNDAELKKIISKGGAVAGLSPTMPPWGAMLSEQELEGIIAYIKSLKSVQ